MRRIIILILVLLSFFSCRKEDSENPEGPYLNDLYGEFSVIEGISLSHENINFAQDNGLVISAELSKMTEWIIEIKGEVSGATRTINGFDRVISNDNAIWNGGANTFPAFGLEKAYISISFPNEPESPILMDSVIIDGSKIDDGTLITGFESGVGSNWDITFSNAPSSILCGGGEAAAGDCVYGWEGRVDWDWGIGNILVRPEEGTFSLPSNGANLYFNMAVNFIENVGDMQCAMVLSFQEDENGDGVFDSNTEDAYPFEYWYQNEGWQLMSINYNDLQFDAEGNQVDVLGNGLPEPSKLIGIDIIYIANKDGGKSKALIDHLIFTTDGPYTP